MWNLWLFGDNERNIGPFKFINRRYDLTTDLCKQNFTRTKKVIERLINYAVEARKIVSDSDITKINTQSLFDYCMPILIREVYVDGHERPTDININTLGNKLQKQQQNNSNNN